MDKREKKYKIQRLNEREIKDEGESTRQEEEESYLVFH